MPSYFRRVGFIASADVRRTQYEPGRASYWVRTPVALLEDEEVSAYARAASLFDTTVSFGPSGFGLTSSVVHDAEGPIGTVAQCLTLRPTRAPSSDDTTGA